MGVEAPVPPPCDHPGFNRQSDGRFKCNECCFCVANAMAAVDYLKLRAGGAFKPVSSPAPPPRTIHR